MFVSNTHRMSLGTKLRIHYRTYAWYNFSDPGDVLNLSSRTLNEKYTSVLALAYYYYYK